MSRCHGSKKFWIPTNRGPANKVEKTRKINMYDFVPVHDCTQEQNSSPCFSSIVRQCEWPSLSRKIVKIHICYYGNVTSYFSSL